jgi:hypothetical protein
MNQWTTSNKSKKVTEANLAGDKPGLNKWSRRNLVQMC